MFDLAKLRDNFKPYNKFSSSETEMNPAEITSGREKYLESTGCQEPIGGICFKYG
jgi:hypothetical protein